MTTSKQEITDNAKGKYFIVVPNMADDDLSPYEMRLLVHYIRVAWRTGKCWEGIRKTAKITQMSVGMVTKTRNELEKLGYIRVKHREDDTCVIVIVDRMTENVARYANETEESDGDEFAAPSGKRSQKRTGVHDTRQGVHEVNTSELEGVHEVKQRRYKTKEEEKESLPAASASSASTWVIGETAFPLTAAERLETTDVSHTHTSADMPVNQSSAAMAETPPASKQDVAHKNAPAPLSPQDAAAPLSPLAVTGDEVKAEKAMKKTTRSEKQLARDEATRIAMNALAQAMGVTLAKADEKRYAQIANTLVGSGITYAEFELYVKRIRLKAKEQNNWEVTPDSLINKGRITEYITARDKHRADQQAGRAHGQFGASTGTAQYHRAAVIERPREVSADVLDALLGRENVS